MAKLGPLFSISARGRKDWSECLVGSDSQLALETATGGIVVETFSPTLREALLDGGEFQWIFLGQVLREDEEILYAFASPRERTLFEELRNIDGIGPKSAAVIVGKLGPEGFKKILSDPRSISTLKIPGLGPKNLEKFSLGLKQKKRTFSENCGQC